MGSKTWVTKRRNLLSAFSSCACFPAIRQISVTVVVPGFTISRHSMNFCDSGLGGFQLGIVGSDDDGEPERIVEANNKKERGQRIALQDSSVNAKCIGFSLRSNNHSTGVLVHDSNSADDIQRNPIRFQDMKHFVAVNRIESLAEIDKHKYCLLVKVSQLFYNASERENRVERHAPDMLLNGKKSQLLLICSSRGVPSMPPLTLGGDLVPVTSVAKGLGFTFDSKLSWEEHVRASVANASSRLHFLRLLTKQGMIVDDLIQVYLSLIRPVLEYGHVLLVGCNVALANSMERVQRHALRIISCGGRRDVPALPSLKERRESAAVSLFRSMLNPEHPLHDLVPPQRATATGRILRNSQAMSAPRARTKRLQQSFLHRAIALYNEELTYH
ncbi:hypothetical protein Bbelb_110000 [Branchiostoma belcheri]|nr:hypothetical protein Bbelb_110000 [Branchiostoma belcheri]